MCVLMQTIWHASSKQASDHSEQSTASKASGQADQPAQQASTASTWSHGVCRPAQALHRERDDCVDMYCIHIHPYLIVRAPVTSVCLLDLTGACMDFLLCSVAVHVCIHIHIYNDMHLYNVHLIFRQMALAQKVIVLGLCFVGGGGRRAKSAP